MKINNCGKMEPEKKSKMLEKLEELEKAVNCNQEITMSIYSHLKIDNPVKGCLEPCSRPPQPLLEQRLDLMDDIKEKSYQTNSLLEQIYCTIKEI
jgi:hypothetical protein